MGNKNDCSGLQVTTTGITKHWKQGHDKNIV